MPATVIPPERSPSAASRARARRQLLRSLRRLALLGALLCLLILAGTVGFALTDGVSIWRGFIWTLDTISTVGSLPEPSAISAQVLKVFLIVLGVGTLFYGLVTVAEFFVAGHLSGLLEERRMQKMINSLSDHYIICGFGRVGRQVAQDLRAAGAAYVVIDANPENRDLAELTGAPFLEASPSDDHALLQAGIDRARAVIACIDSDSENVFVTLTARELRGDVTIVARASEEDSQKKLKRAGATRIISPYKASGSEMARAALHPHVAGVHVAPEYRLEEIEVQSDCEGDGRKIEDIRGSSVIVALRRPDGSFQPLPPGEVILEPGDVLVAMGDSRTMDRLESLFTPTGTTTRPAPS